MEYTPAATPHSEYVLVETVDSSVATVRTASGGIEVIKPGVGARMPLRQALDLIERGAQQRPKAKLKITGVVRQLDPAAGIVGEYVEGATVDNDPSTRRDELGFPILEA